MRFNLSKQFLAQLMNWDDIEATERLKEIDKELTKTVLFTMINPL